MPDYTAELRAMPYEEYLQTAHWKEVRAAALRDGGFKCQGCFVRRVVGHYRQPILQVHHLTYARLGAERPDDLIVLCRECHQMAHIPGLDLVAWDAMRWASVALANHMRVTPAYQPPPDPIYEDYMDEEDGYMRSRPLPYD